MANLTHFDQRGNARMVDVSAKGPSLRTATAKGRVVMSPATLAIVESRMAAKGDVLAVAQLAGIMAAKRTAELSPLCHPLGLDAVEVDLVCDPAVNAVEITATCRTHGPTGVEMEAMCAVSVAALTVYDMLKSAERGLVIEAVRLVHKAGGKSGTYTAP